MTRTLLLLPALSLIACGGDDAKDTAPTEESCTITVSSTTPALNAVDAYYRGTIDFTLTAADPTATITTDIPGTKEVSADGKTISWVPTNPLTPSTAYSATLSYCAGDAVLNFTTSALGTALADASTLEGKVYTIDLTDPNIKITEPAGLSALLPSLLSQVNLPPILVGVADTSESTITMLGAVGKDNTTAQDYCNPSIAFPAANFTNPYFELPEGDLPLSLMGATFTIQDLAITGTFAPDGSAFGGGTLQGRIDTRPFDSQLGGETGAVCNTAANLTIDCVPCNVQDGTEPYCLQIKAESILAAVASGPALVQLDAECDQTACSTYTADDFDGVTPGQCPG